MWEQRENHGCRLHFSAGQSKKENSFTSLPLVAFAKKCHDGVALAPKLLGRQFGEEKTHLVKQNDRERSKRPLGAKTAWFGLSIALDLRWTQTWFKLDFLAWMIVINPSNKITPKSSRNSWIKAKHETGQNRAKCAQGPKVSLLCKMLLAWSKSDLTLQK